MYKSLRLNISVYFEFHKYKVTKTYRSRCLTGKKTRLYFSAPNSQIFYLQLTNFRHSDIQNKCRLQNISSVPWVHFMENVRTMRPLKSAVLIFCPFSVQTSSDWFFFFSSESKCAGVRKSTEQILSLFWLLEFFTCTVSYSGTCFSTGPRDAVNQKIWGDYELGDKALSLKGRMTDTFKHNCCFQLLWRWCFPGEVHRLQCEKTWVWFYLIKI